MKLRRVLAISLSLCMLFGMSLNSMADAPSAISTPNNEGEYVITKDGDLNVVDEPYAIEANSPNIDGPAEAVITVNGNVNYTLDAINAGAALDFSTDNDETAVITVNGDVNAVSDKNAFILGISPSTGAGNADITIKGDLNVSSLGISAGVDTPVAGSASVNIEGDISVNSNNANAEGITLHSTDSTVNIGGSVYVNSALRTTGIRSTNTHNENPATHIVNVDGDIDVYSYNETRGGTYGIVSTNPFTNSTITVNNDVYVGAASGLSLGVILSTPDAAKDNSVIIKGDLTSDFIGVYYQEVGTGIANVVIDGTLDASVAPVMREAVSNDDMSNISLIAWQINPNAEGNIAVKPSGDTPILAATPAAINDLKLVGDSDFDKNNIFYIIKSEQPTEGGTFEVFNEDGSMLEKKFDRYVAKEGTRLLIKPKAMDGYALTSFYNGFYQALPIVKDANGNTYFTVTKGGGIYFRALFDQFSPYAELTPYEIEELLRLEEAEDALDFINAAPQNGNVTIACFHGKLDDSVVTKLKERNDLTTTVICSYNDVYGKIVIPAGTDLSNLINKYDGSIKLSDLVNAFGFTAIKD